jgi:hypothetical protein
MGTPCVDDECRYAQVFPSEYPDHLTPDDGLQRRLDKALNDYNLRYLPITIVELGGRQLVAGNRQHEEHYSASLIKVAAMYSAYELCKAAGMYAVNHGITVPDDLFDALERKFNPVILRKLNDIISQPGVNKTTTTYDHYLPRYRQILSARSSSGTGLTVSLSPQFKVNMHQMIVPSSNDHAGRCVRALGYGYILGALESGGFYKKDATNGIWLAGDYSGSTVWPYIRIPCVNDRDTSQGTTTYQMARWYSVLRAECLVDYQSDLEMLGLLRETVTGPIHECFIDRAANFKSLSYDVTHTKVGLGPLKKPPDGPGGEVMSEGSILRRKRDQRFFAVAWQNMSQVQFDELANAIDYVIQ